MFCCHNEDQILGDPHSSLPQAPPVTLALALELSERLLTLIKG